MIDRKKVEELAVEVFKLAHTRFCDAYAIAHFILTRESELEESIASAERKIHESGVLAGQLYRKLRKAEEALNTLEVMSRFHTPPIGKKDVRIIVEQALKDLDE